MRFGLAVQSMPARLARSVTRVLDHFIANRHTGRGVSASMCCATRLDLPRADRRPGETAAVFPEIYQDWGDDEALFRSNSARGPSARYRQSSLVSCF